MIKNKLTNKKGFMSIEAIMSMAVVLVVIMLGVGFFSYMIPRQAISEEVHLLGRIAKMEGRLTKEDVTQFEDRMIAKNVIKPDGRSEVKVEVYRDSTTQKSNLPLNIVEGKRVSRGEKFDENSPYYAVLRVVVTVPAKKAGLVGALQFFSVSDKLSDNYVFSERIMSEYYGGES